MQRTLGSEQPPGELLREVFSVLQRGGHLLDAACPQFGLGFGLSKRSG
jgi:hypothetical protein